MKKRIIVSILVVCVVLLAFVACAAYAQTTHATQQTVTRHIVATVCTDKGLTGAAQTENLLYCATNMVTGTTTNMAPSTYQQAIALAKTKGIVIGTPMSVSQTVNKAGVPITYVEFSSGFHAWHFNPSHGIATIDDPYGKQVYP